MSDFYHDDPVEGVVVARKKPKALFAVLLLFASGLVLNTTLAANINLNSGQRVEFGQGMTLTTACSGSSVLTATPNASFVNASGSGSFYFKSITVTDIPSTCNGVDFTLSVYDSSTSSALPIFATDKREVRIWNDGGTFKLGSGSVSGATITSSSGAFTVSFTTPVALASDVSRMTLQSASHVAYSCALDLVCSLGDTGPGGGTVFYVSAAGFNCGPNHTSTGSPTGGLCNYLEAAPANWSGGQDPARAFVPPSFTTEIPNHPKPPKTNSTSELGLGYKYSEIVAAVSADKTYAAGRARTYNGGGRSDWYLPVTTELNQLCKYVAGQAWVSDTTICTGSSNPSLGMSTEDGYWTSSGTSEYAKAAMMQRMLNGIQEEKFYVHIGAKIRPIRAF
jgi:hypothetical protein